MELQNDGKHKNDGKNKKDDNKNVETFERLRLMEVSVTDERNSQVRVEFKGDAEEGEQIKLMSNDTQPDGKSGRLNSAGGHRSRIKGDVIVTIENMNGSWDGQVRLTVFLQYFFPKLIKD